eukprot:jgi/Botrbrau1/23267/Bobra.0102s0012.1
MLGTVPVDRYRAFHDENFIPFVGTTLSQALDSDFRFHSSSLHAVSQYILGLSQGEAMSMNPQLITQVSTVKQEFTKSTYESLGVALSYGVRPWAYPRTVKDVESTSLAQGPLANTAGMASCGFSKRDLC